MSTTRSAVPPVRLPPPSVLPFPHSVPFPADPAANVIPWLHSDRSRPASQNLRRPHRRQRHLLHRSPRRDLRPARPQRRRQDHHHRLHFRPPYSHRRPCPHHGPRRGARRHRCPPRARRRPPGNLALRGPFRPRKPQLLGRHAGHAQSPAPPAHPGSARPSPACRTAPASPSNSSAAACGGA